MENKKQLPKKVKTTEALPTAPSFNSGISKPRSFLADDVINIGHSRNSRKQHFFTCSRD